MSRLRLVIAAAALVALAAFTSSAFAGPRDNGYGGARGYGGPLGVGPTFGAKDNYGYGTTPQRKKRTYKAKTKPTSRSSKKSSTAKAAPKESESKNEHSTISGRSSEADGKKTANAADDTEIRDETPVAKKVGCKKYFAAADQTITVPCE